MGHGQPLLQRKRFNWYDSMVLLPYWLLDNPISTIPISHPIHIELPINIPSNAVSVVLPFHLQISTDWFQGKSTGKRRIFHYIIVCFLFPLCLLPETNPFPDHVPIPETFHKSRVILAAKVRPTIYVHLLRHLARHQNSKGLSKTCRRWLWKIIQAV